MSIKDRLLKLREYMRKQKVSAFIIPSTDPHSGEYIPEYWESRKWISGFTGSAGTVVVTLEEAGLWTDSRYFLQAEEQLKDTGIQLLKERIPGTPSISEWLGARLQKGDILGLDGWVNATQTVSDLKNELDEYGLVIQMIEDPFQSIWEDRPFLPLTPVSIQPLSFAGETVDSKTSRIKQNIRQHGATGILLSALDEVAWTLNLRGSDVHCNPVFISYLLLTDEGDTLYIKEEKLSAEVKEHLKENKISVRPYEAIAQDLAAYREKHQGRLQLSPSINGAVYLLGKEHADILIKTSPVAHFKAIKNDTEIAGFRNAMEKDGVAMVKFLRWMEENAPSGKETELSIDRQLFQFRSEQELFKGISFDTIAGYKKHAAIVHYEATPETDIPLLPKGMLLLDSGAQYVDGTTDITRTLVLGELTEEEKRDYTLVLKGHLQLQNASFPEGTCGTQLDILARLAMWKEGINYLHGTGHGVGHYLCVHEGPHQIRINNMPAPIVAGMTVTDEPGIYKSERHGIRIENTLLVVDDKETEFGKFYKFEPLTLCPIETRAIVKEMLTDEEIEWFNQYHQMVYNRLQPLLNEEEQAWLKEKTAPIYKNQ